MARACVGLGRVAERGCCSSNAPACTAPELTVAHARCRPGPRTPGTRWAGGPAAARARPVHSRRAGPGQPRALPGPRSRRAAGQGTRERNSCCARCARTRSAGGRAQLLLTMAPWCADDRALRRRCSTARGKGGDAGGGSERAARQHAAGPRRAGCTGSVRPCLTGLAQPPCRRRPGAACWLWRFPLTARARSEHIPLAASCPAMTKYAVLAGCNYKGGPRTLAAKARRPLPLATAHSLPALPRPPRRHQRRVGVPASAAAAARSTQQPPCLHPCMAARSCTLMHPAAPSAPPDVLLLPLPALLA